MKIDLRDKLKNDKKMKELPNNHRNIFEQKLKSKLHQKPITNYSFLRIAASIVLIFSIGYFALMMDGPLVNTGGKSNKVSVGNISTEFKKMENVYLTAINYQIARIKITEENRDFIEVFLSQLSDLQKEYSDLSDDLNKEKEVSEITLDAMIENLQLQLHLMQQLKKNLEKINNIKLEKNERNQV